MMKSDRDVVQMLAARNTCNSTRKTPVIEKKKICMYVDVLTSHGFDKYHSQIVNFSFTQGHLVNKIP